MNNIDLDYTNLIVHGYTDIRRSQAAQIHSKVALKRIYSVYTARNHILTES